jgi:hypothetical protein
MGTRKLVFSISNDPCPEFSNSGDSTVRNKDGVGRHLLHLQDRNFHATEFEIACERQGTFVALGIEGTDLSFTAPDPEGSISPVISTFKMGKSMHNQFV